MLDCLFVIAGFLVVTLLFRFAAGSLSLRRLNIVSITYYFYTLMIYLGTSLALLGLNRNHYLIRLLSQDEIAFSFAIVLLTGIGIPIIIILVNGAFGILRASEVTERQFDLPVSCNLQPVKIKAVLCVLLVVGFFSLVYTFIEVGGIPLLDAITGADRGENAIRRMEVSRGFQGNIYIKNLGMLVLIPLTSYFSFICYRSYGGSGFKACFILSVVLSVLALTYDLEKAPIVYYCFCMFVLSELCGSKYPIGKILLFGCGMVALIILAYYVVSGTSGLVLSFENGPLSRLTSTTSAALMLHFHIFPDQFPFLDGQSFPGWITEMFFGSDGGVRSGRVVMAAVNPQGIKDGVAGVMNAFFVGEAYANWGLLGVVVSWFAVGSLLGVSNALFMRSRKTPISLLLYITIIQFNASALIGGFIDYLYSVSLGFSLFVIAAIYLYSFDGSLVRAVGVEKSVVKSGRLG